MVTESKLTATRLRSTWRGRLVVQVYQEDFVVCRGWVGRWRDARVTDNLYLVTGQRPVRVPFEGT